MSPLYAKNCLDFDSRGTSWKGGLPCLWRDSGAGWWKIMTAVFSGGRVRTGLHHPLGLEGLIIARAGTCRDCALTLAD